MISRQSISLLHQWAAILTDCKGSLTLQFHYIIHIHFMRNLSTFQLQLRSVALTVRGYCENLDVPFILHACGHT
jgi:hypothetical protein